MSSHKDGYLTGLQWMIDTTNASPKEGVISLSNSIILQHLKTQGKSYQGKVAEIDGLAPEGIDQLTGPTAVRVLFSDWRMNLTGEISKTIQTGLKNSVNSYLLLIVDRVPEDMHSLISDAFGENSFIIWDVEQIFTHLQTYYPEFKEVTSSIDFAAALTRAGVYAVVESSQMYEASDAEWILNNQSVIEQMGPMYRTEGVVLFLGAGISIDAGLLSWNSLLTELRIDMIEDRLKHFDITITADEKKMMTDTLSRLQGSDPLQTALYTKIALHDSFEESVAKALYKNVKDERPLLSSIAEFCKPERGAQGVKAIVTYNFDDLLEVELEKHDIKYQSIHSGQDRRKMDVLPIYHVHGFMPSDVSAEDSKIDADLVFSEVGYHSLYNEPYHWANIAQLNFLIENTCMMIGLSLTDPNLRRLLRIASERGGTPRHYVCLKRRLASQFPEGENVPKREIIASFLNAHYSVQEYSLKALGLNTIWFPKYEDIADILQTIQNRNSTPS